ncbi:MAG: MFS transporter [Bacillota bacterium]|nr:MFS transporter [Bacillota bacterium]
MNRLERLKRNIKLNYLFTFLSRLDITSGVWMIYLASKGVTLTKLGILESVFHITSFFMEIPTGAIADIFGRKYSRILGRFMKIIGTILLISSNSYMFYLISFALTAVSYNLESGAGDALVYDSLKELKDEDSYMKVSGTNEVFFQISDTLSLVLGGILSNINYSYAYIASIMVASFAFAESFLFQEPSSYKEDDKTSFFRQIRESFKIIYRKRKVGFLIIFSSIISIFVTTMFYYFQNFIVGKGYSKFTLGLILASASLLSAFCAFYTHKIERRLKEKGILIYLPIVLSLSFWGIAATKFYVFFFILANAVESIIFITTSAYINKLIPSDKRATILSMESMVFSLFMIILFPLAGKLGDLLSLTFSFYVSAILISILSIMNIIILTGRKN